MFDFLALLGSGVFEKVIPNNTLFGLMKLLRVKRLSKWISKLNVSKTIKINMILIKLLLYLILYLHCLGCFWYF